MIIIKKGDMKIKRMLPIGLMAVGFIVLYSFSSALVSDTANQPCVLVADDTASHNIRGLDTRGTGPRIPQGPGTQGEPSRSMIVVPKAVDKATPKQQLSIQPSGQDQPGRNKIKNTSDPTQ